MNVTLMLDCLNDAEPRLFIFQSALSGKKIKNDVTDEGRFEERKSFIFDIKIITNSTVDASMATRGQCIKGKETNAS